jgi:hypothetical protein
MNPQNWMGSVPDDVYLSRLSIPGTHDTLTFSATLAAQDQDASFNIAAQLNAGIRYFDLRLNPTTTGFPLKYILQGFHGGLLDNTEFAANILQPTVTFLTNNPTECVIYQITHAGGDFTPPKFDGLLWDYMLNQGWSWFYNANVVPTLGQVRKQIVLADHNGGGKQSWKGLDFTGWPDDQDTQTTTTLTLPDGQPVTFSVQNIYDDVLSPDRSVEGHAIQDNIANAAYNTDPHQWYVTYTSRASGIPTSKQFATGWNPPYIADDGWPSQIGFNQVTLNSIIEGVGVTGGSGQTTIGTVCSDFPNDTSGYIEAIYTRNPTPGGWTPSQTGWEVLGEPGGGFDPEKQPAAVSWGLTGWISFRSAPMARCTTRPGTAAAGARRRQAGRLWATRVSQDRSP